MFLRDKFSNLSTGREPNRKHENKQKIFSHVSTHINHGWCCICIS